MVVIITGLAKKFIWVLWVFPQDGMEKPERNFGQPNIFVLFPIISFLFYILHNE